MRAGPPRISCRRGRRASRRSWTRVPPQSSAVMSRAGPWIKMGRFISLHEIPHPPPHLVRGGGNDSAAGIRSGHPPRVDALFNVISADIARESDRIGARLAALKSSLVADDRFRSWVVRGENRGYVLDYAGDAMRLAGLDFLLIQDDDGRVVSSGHFRNEYDRLGPAVPGAGPALVRAATAESSF